MRDIDAMRRKIGANPDVILISGDIAFAGDKDEYEFATKWLAELCEKIDAPMSWIFICPGNHDVTRTTSEDRVVVQTLHDGIKATGDVGLHKKLMDLLLDAHAARLLYESLDNYNAFAQQFFCDLLPPDPDASVPGRGSERRLDPAAVGRQQLLRIQFRRQGR